MKRYGIVLAAVFALVAVAVSLRAQAQDNDPDRWMKIDGWVGNFRAERKVDACFGKFLVTTNDSVSGSIRFNERILKKNKIIWKGTTTATVRLDRKKEILAICGGSGNDRQWGSTKGSGTATDTGKLVINLRRGTYKIDFGDLKIEEVERKGGDLQQARLLALTAEYFIGYHERDKLPVSGLVLSGTQTFDDPSNQPLPFIISWDLQPDDCSESSDIPEVVIEKPVRDAELIFLNEPGEISSKTIAVVASEVPERSLEWTFPEIAGSTLKTKPEDGRGKIVEFFYEGMPEENSEFDKEREVSVILAPFRECMEPVKQPVRVFFELDKMGNPAGEAPNWFYYWMQTSAGYDQGQVKYGGNGGDCATSFGWFDYRLDPETITICDGAKEAAANPITGRTTDGIDTFAITVIHEMQHKTDYKNWWGDFDKEHRPDDSYNPAGTFEHKAAWRDYSNKRKQADRDGDHIPDKLEEGMGFDPTDPDSQDRGYSDNEYSAYEAESAWVIGRADEEDWAVPGKQSGGN